MSEQLTFWFDLENAPDVLYFEPITKSLRELGHTVYTTSRDYSAVPELAELYGIGGAVVGKHGGNKKISKILVGLQRSLQLMLWSRGKNIDLAVGFGSRPMAVACGLLRMPNVTVYDYEHVFISALNRFCDWIFVPQEVPLERLTARGTPEHKLLRYSGLKEEVYTGVYEPDYSLLEKLKLDPERIIVTIRPPATLAHYHDHTSVVINQKILEDIAKQPDVQCILMNRADDETFNDFLKYPNINDLPFPVKGLDLIAISDAMISGGGTMVREAAALGVPAFSTFTGEQGAVDEELDRLGRLMLVRDPADVAKIEYHKRTDRSVKDFQKTQVRDFFVQEYIRLAKDNKAGSKKA
ncbi:DUF354 domain-containing protein [Candidatus Venteria ishoeyi]|uniref:DUF354 domain-containing protein n=1 Tax=Candidatus Venteria ishoeyi TaxID=1899563 RepID=A0A1H6FB66_9GAMM|nr:DUF354 domain-containing protein [Candidatus Venteria ishoeyi]MDM8545764.1 DUF354 domain-containing protein [Candidatus Venteria ishoeyi]SEH06883.1 Uncharacterised protein [Candidatus Venteria ishoeyi]